MGVIIKQYEGSSVSPKDDAIMHEIFNDQSGVIRGCEITYLGSNQIRVGEGYLYICGRVIQIEEETVLSSFAEEETEGELILKIDLLSETPGKLLARVPKAELTQEDINGAGAVYEYPLASYVVSDVAISGLTIGYEFITAGFSKDKILGTLEEVGAATEAGFLVDALAVSELNSNMESINSNMKSMQTSFQDGCDTIVAAVTAKGQTPASNSPSDISAAIGKISVAPTKLNGTTSLWCSNGGMSFSTTVTFSTAFSTTPTINISATSDRPTQVLPDGWSITSKSKAGFTITSNTSNPGYGTLTFTWNAVV